MAQITLPSMTAPLSKLKEEGHYTVCKLAKPIKPGQK
jgi:hypothetical protein